ncbi:hypothetical protein ACJX0J_033194, partial [Zea mays]
SIKKIKFEQKTISVIYMVYFSEKYCFSKAIGDLRTFVEIFMLSLMFLILNIGLLDCLESTFI